LRVEASEASGITRIRASISVPSSVEHRFATKRVIAGRLFANASKVESVIHNT